ncbi:hypothetical protein ACWGOQ_0011735 [Aquimarina sp. M1]
MLKNILKVNGVQEMNKGQQKSINGGGPGSNCDDIQGCRYGGYLSFAGGGVVLNCCAGTPNQ